MGLLLGFLILRSATGRSVAKIRLLPALDTLDEVVRQAAEKGQPVVVAIGRKYEQVVNELRTLAASKP
jgi:hydroxymethylpyrimidine pyrophosphatase-like HAD family hydrolase